MKRHTLFIYIAALLTMLGTALLMSAQNKSFTVNRNDGASQKYSYSQGDRLVLSREDSQGKKHADFVEQQVYVGNDVHNFPLTSIESITFDAQATEDEGKTFVIQESGGKIEYGDITLDFPSGTFKGDAKVKVLEIDGGKMIEDEEAVSKFYKVTMPVSTNNSFKASIKCNVKGDDIGMIAQSLTVSTHSGNESYSDIRLASTYSNGVYTVDIPAFENEDIEENASFSLGMARLHDNNSTQGDGTSAAYMTRSSTDGNIKWHKLWFKRWGSPNRAEINSDINEAMSEAVKIIKDLGFKVPGDRDIPILFKESGFRGGEYAVHEQDMFSDEWNVIKLNSPLLFGSEYDREALKRTIVHELFHYFQAAYDPRCAFRKAKIFLNSSKTLVTVFQIMEAGGVWIEKFASNNYWDYGWKEGGFYQVLRSAFGVGVGEDGDSLSIGNAQMWGYGSSLFLEYIAQETGKNSSILQLYQNWKDKGLKEFGFMMEDFGEACNVDLFGVKNNFYFTDFIEKLADGRLITFGPYNGAYMTKPDPFKFSARWFQTKKRDDLLIESNAKYTIKNVIHEFGIHTNRINMVNYKNSSGNKDMNNITIRFNQKSDDAYTLVYLVNEFTDECTRLGRFNALSPLTISDKKTLEKAVTNHYYLYLVTGHTYNYVPIYYQSSKFEIELTVDEVLQVEPNTPQEFEAEGGTKTLTVKTNQPKWGVTKKGDWFKYSTSKNELTVTADPNTTSDPREGYLEIYALNEKNEKVSEPVTIKVTQKVMFTKIEVEPSKSLEFEAAGGTVTLTVTTNQPQWSITKKTGDWYNYSTSGNKLTVTAFANPTSDPRDGYLEICAFNEKNEKVSEPVTIKVKQKAKVVVKLQMSLHINIALFDGRYEQDLKPIWVNLINDENKTEIVVNRNKDDDRYQVMCKGEDGEISFDSDVDIINDLDRLKSGKVEINNLSCMRDGRFSLVATGSSGNSYKEDENSITYGWDYGSIIYFHDTMTGATLPSPSGKWIVTGGVSITRPK
jgi:hypothetical protein